MVQDDLKKENAKASKGCLVVLGIVVAIFLWWFFTPSEEEKAAEKQKMELQKIINESDRRQDSLSKVPKDILVRDFYADYRKNSISPKFDLEHFQTFRKNVVGTKYEARIQKSIDSLILIVAKSESVEKAKERKVYENTLRNNFLDAGLDIKVRVSGKESSVITLEYALFNDVWFRKFEKEGHFDRLAGMGFVKIVLDDGYDYKKWMTYE